MNTPQPPLNFWDQNYASEGYKYGTAPNAFLTEQAWRLPAAAPVLLPGDGEGRNGVWLARRGHPVTTVDSSRIGVAKARSLAQEAGVTMQALCADLADWQPPRQAFAGLVLTYLHLPPGLRGEVHPRLAEALAPDGWLILEAFHPRQLDYASGGPKAAEMLYSLDLLRGDFGSHLEEVFAWEGEVRLDEGPGHQGAAWVTRWVARKPA